jgi:HK97 family phage prohead protease
MPNDMLIRQADFQVNSYDPANRTFTAVIATDAPVLRHDPQGAYSEILPADAFDLSAQRLSVLDSHNTATVRAVLGRTLSIRREGNQIVADLQLSSAEDVVPIGQRIADGTLSGISIGYAVTGWATRREGGRRIKTASHVLLREVTLTSNPADPKATVRQQKESAMPKDVQDQEGRATLIQRLVAAHDLPDEWATRMEEAGEELTDDEVRTQARAAAAEALQTRARQTPRIRTVAKQDDPATVMQHRSDALFARVSGAAPTEQARPYMADSLRDHARAAVEATGTSTRGMDADQLFRAAMHTTSDFPGLLTSTGNRTLMGGYQAAQSPIKTTLARQATMADFRPSTRLKLSDVGLLEKVSESGEIKSTTRGEAAESYALDTYATQFAISRKALINDDLGAFRDWGATAGRMAAETEANLLLKLLLSNPVMNEDGLALFHATHNNLAAAAALSVATLDAARKSMRSMKALDKKTPINATPKFLVVGPEQETAAEQVLAAIYAATVADVNPFGGKLTLLVEPRITDDRFYIFADPAVLPVLEYAYLSSAQGPQMASREGWDVLGMEFRVVLDFGCGAVDWRGAYLNPGA